MFIALNILICLGVNLLSSLLLKKLSNKNTYGNIKNTIKNCIWGIPKIALLGVGFSLVGQPAFSIILWSSITVFSLSIVLILLSHYEKRTYPSGSINGKDGNPETQYFNNLFTNLLGHLTENGRSIHSKLTDIEEKTYDSIAREACSTLKTCPMGHTCNSGGAGFNSCPNRIGCYLDRGRLEFQSQSDEDSTDNISVAL